MKHRIEEAIDALQEGHVIIVTDDEDRENEGDFIALTEQASPEVINFMITYGKGLVCTAITESLADQIGLTMMASKNTDPLSTAFTVSIDHKDTKTGISAAERSKTIQTLADPEATEADFRQPGHVFPLIAKEGGVFERPGHTEAAVDLAALSGAFPSAVICEIINEDGTMARRPDLEKLAARFGLKMITIAELIEYRKGMNALLDNILLERKIKIGHNI